MTRDPKAAEEFARLVLVTARALRAIIDEPLRPKTRAQLLAMLDEVLAPFDTDGDCPRGDPDCIAGDGQCHDACVNPRDDNCELPKPPVRLER